MCAVHLSWCVCKVLSKRINDTLSQEDVNVRLWHQALSGLDQACHSLWHVQEHPVNEALFNLVNVWSLMLWPLMLADKKGVKVKNKFGWYLGTQVKLTVIWHLHSHSA